MRWLRFEGFLWGCPVSILSSLVVYLLGVKYRLSNHPDGPIFDFFVKTASMPGVARCASELLDFYEHRVVVTVNADFFNQLHIPGSFSFNPEGLPAAALVGGLAG